MEQNPKITVQVKFSKTLREEVAVPLMYQTAGSAAVDLRADIEEDVWIHPGDIVKMSSGVSLNMPKVSMAAIVLPRSGLGVEGLNLANTAGLIDADYQGLLWINVKNTGYDALHVCPGDRVAQLLFIPIIKPIFEYVEEFSEATERGANGFGSTGVKQ